MPRPGGRNPGLATTDGKQPMPSRDPLKRVLERDTAVQGERADAADGGGRRTGEGSRRLPDSRPKRRS